MGKSFPKVVVDDLLDVEPQVVITCPGSPGHGSRFVENNAGEKAQSIINKLLEFRESEKKKLESNPDLTLGDVTTVNLTIMQVCVLSYCYYIH